MEIYYRLTDLDSEFENEKEGGVSERLQKVLVIEKRLD